MCALATSACQNRYLLGVIQDFGGLVQCFLGGNGASGGMEYDFRFALDFGLQNVTRDY